MPDHCVTTRRTHHAPGNLAPGHLGELTQIVPFEMVDTALEETNGHQQRSRLLPARVVVYLLLAAGLFAHCGWPALWRKLTAGVGLRTQPAASALFYARKRLGPAPLKALFELLSGPTHAAHRFKGLLVCAIDGTLLDTPATQANRAVHRSSGATRWAGAGYPQLRVLALVATGSRALLGAVFGPVSQGETTMAGRLLPVMGPGQLVLADRGFDAADLLKSLHASGAHLLVRMGSQSKPRRLRPLGDGSWLVQRGPVRVRLIEAEITIATEQGRRTGSYRLATTLVDPVRYPAAALVALYHQRWEIETAYCELKWSLLGRRVLRAKDPEGLEQEVWALLATYQVVRQAIADAVTATGHSPLRASFAVAVESGRDLLVRAENIIAGGRVDLRGTLGRQVLANLLPERRVRTVPRVVKRAISKYHARSNGVDRTTYKATVDIAVLTDP
ncbi:IS4 family transposase [Nocardiopsis protaetiae]|uniref:IS4 family transposase n=2 Tax=Nocardiopsidaceae TaxID=83676 RepID=UPI00387AAA88